MPEPRSPDYAALHPGYGFNAGLSSLIALQWRSQPGFGRPESLPDRNLPRYTAGAVDYAPDRGRESKNLWEKHHDRIST
jgi:hypothetical protein